MRFIMCRYSKEVGAIVGSVYTSHAVWDYTKFIFVGVPLFWPVVVPGVLTNVIFRAWLGQDKASPNTHKKKASK